MAVTAQRDALAPVPHPPVAERAELGRAARRHASRSALGLYEPRPDRADPVALLSEQAATRVPELVPIRYGRMLVSDFTFYRGAAAIMAHDLAPAPRTGLMVQCCGDAHLSNFGAFASPERRLVFDVNDFDETLQGPFEWDVKRLAASMVIAARDNGFAPKHQDRIVLETVAAYRSSMRAFAGMNALDVWYAHLDIEQAVRDLSADTRAKDVQRAEKQLAKARTRDNMSTFAKLTHVVDGQVRIVDQSPLIVPLDRLATGETRERIFDELHRLLRGYRHSLQTDRRVLLEQFELRDFARKVVGVGSVGTRAWIALMLGREDGDPLFLQLKEAQRSVLEPYLGHGGFANHGERVVAGQRLMQATSDIFLGWLHVDAGLDGGARDFYVRQLKDWKASAAIDRMSPRTMAIYGTLCGWTLSRAHARSGDRIAIAAYLGTGDAFDRAMLAFSHAYAEQNAQDHAALAGAVDAGRITAEPGI